MNHRLRGKPSTGDRGSEAALAAAAVRLHAEQQDDCRPLLAALLAEHGAYGWIVMSSAFEADTPDGGHGGGEVGPAQKNCAKSRTPAKAASLGIDTVTSLAPTLLLVANSGTKGEKGSIQTSAASTTIGLGAL